MKPDQPEPDQPEPVDSTDRDDADILLADPDDYHQTQRLREIHDARRNVHDVLGDLDTYTSKRDHSAQRGELAIAVTAYITELEPLFQKADVDTELPEDFPWDTLSAYATTMGRNIEQDGDPRAAYETSLFVFMRANDFLEQVKPLIEQDETDEWDV